MVCSQWCKPRTGVQFSVLLVKVLTGHKSKPCQNDDQQRLILSKETDSTTKVDKVLARAVIIVDRKCNSA